MTNRCITIFPEIANGAIIDRVRAAYDPLAHHVRPHITLVFPFESPIESSELEQHIRSAVSSVPPFQLALRGITTGQPGNYLFLEIGTGRDQIIKLHNRLYTGILKPFLSERFTQRSFDPHMTIGKMRSEQELKRAVGETKDMDQSFETIVQKISVEIIDENDDSTIEMEVRLT